jgi:hypothetical protein
MTEENHDGSNAVITLSAIYWGEGRGEVASIVQILYFVFEMHPVKLRTG